MRKLMITGICAALMSGAVRGAIICSGESAPIQVRSSLPSTVSKSVIIRAAPWGGVGESVTVSVDGTVLFSTTNQSETVWRWQPQTKGNHTLTCTFGTNVLTKTMNVTALDFFVQPAPNPPMAKDNNMSITPTTRNFAVGGGGNAIITSGSSATWTAAVSDPWITLNATSGNVGYPVAYTVSANTNVEQRTGYVYVSGWVHTVTQDGVGGTISPESATYENGGGSGAITVTAANKMVWQARPNVDWLSVSPTSGAGEGSVTYQVAPYNEVATRQGTLTVAGQTFSVFQYGRRMKLDSYSITHNYEAHAIPITVNALAVTTWGVTPNASWISVVDGGNGRGGDLVTIAISENPSYKLRIGTVTIGTETFTVKQQGRPTAALSFNVSPANSTASVNGANGLIAVTATPDLPWKATSGANWLTVYSATANGAGNGNVAYNASPNPTLLERTGKITVTPEAASGMAAKTHTVTQPAAQSALSMNGYEFEASGEACSVEVTVADIVEWSIENTNSWITVNGSTSRVGPGTVVLQAAANGTIYPRSGTVTIAGKTFTVSQKARSVELEYDTILFETDGGYESVSIHPDGNSGWTAVASDPSWITIFQGDSGTGDGEIMYIVSPYVGDGGARTGWITIGDKKVYITQRAYDLSIEPNGTNVAWNAGAGEIGVSASIGDVWTAIVTEPWITLVDGYDAGTGSGKVRFLCAENNTGKTRVGKIIVAGEVYTLEQRARQMVMVTFHAAGGTGGKTFQVDKWSKLGECMGKVNPTLDGYMLDGWWTERTGGERVDESTVITASATYYAHWVSRTCDITFHASGGSGGKRFASAARGRPLSYYMDMVSPKYEANGYSYEFDGWWTARNGGTRVDASAVIDGDATYYAHWVIPTCTVTFHANGGTGGKSFASVAFGRTLGYYMNQMKPKYEVVGHVCEFDGWWTARKGGTKVDASTVATGDATYYAHWIVPTRSVTFHAAGGTGGKTYSIPLGAKLGDYMDKVSPKRDGCTFDGWWTERNGGTRVSASAVVVDAATYYAHWTVQQPPCTVFFHANGGTGGKTFASVAIGAKLSYYMDQVRPSNGSLVFNGWWTERSGGTRILATDMATGDATYYAHWTAASACVKPVNGSADVAASVALANYYGYAYLADGGEAKMLLTVFGDGKATALVGDDVYQGELPLLVAPNGAMLMVVLEGGTVFGFQQ